MRKYIIAIFAMVLFVLPANASDYQESGHAFYSNYQGKKYASFLPEDILKKSPDFDLSNPKLPRPLSEIIEIAFAKLEDITKKREGWDVYRITMTKWHKDNRKWFYAIGFNSYSSSEIGNLTILVTIDGRVGVIKQIQNE